MYSPRRMSDPVSRRQFSLDSDAGDGDILESGRGFSGNPQTARNLICIALIEDRCLAREAITALLGRFSDFEVVAADSDDYAAVVAEIGPDVVLMSSGRGNADTLEIVRTLRTEYPGLRILLVDPLPAPEGLVDFIATGVCGFVLRDASLAQVALTIRSVATGLSVLPDGMVGSLCSEIAREAVAEGRVVDLDLPHLTPREQEVTALVAEGLRNKAIGRRLHISVHTVKTHLRNVMRKLDLQSRLQVAKFVHEHAGGPEGSLPLAGPTTGPLIERTAS